MISFSVSIDPLNRKCRGDAYIAPTVSSRITDEFGKFVTFYKGPMKGIGLYDHLFRQTGGSRFFRSAPLKLLANFHLKSTNHFFCLINQNFNH